MTGLLSNSIRQRLLENKTLDLKTMFDQARSLESAMKSSESYTGSQPSFNSAVPDSPSASVLSQSENLDPTCLAALSNEGSASCFFCGNSSVETVLPELCADLILGLDFQSRHTNVVFNYGGPEPPLSVCGFNTLNVSPPEPFANLSANCHPVATKSRRYSRHDLDFIDKEVQRLLKEGIIESSKSPWRAQVVVTKDENHRKRMVIDYSQTINKFTLLDAFPLPRIDDLVNEMAQYRVFSTVDLRSAYHQVPL